MAGRSGVATTSIMPADRQPLKYAAEAREFAGEIDDFGPLEKERKKAIKKGLKVMCRETRMAVAAAQLAIADAGCRERHSSAIPDPCVPHPASSSERCRFDSPAMLC